MAFYLRVFDPKGFQNPYKGRKWRDLKDATRAEPAQPVRGHRERQAEQPATVKEPPPDVQGRVIPPAPGEETEAPAPKETTIRKAKRQTPLEKEITMKREFYGPGELMAIALDLMEKEPKTIQSGTAIAKAKELLQREEIHYLPVITEKNAVCGLITESQLLKSSAEEGELNELMISPVLCCIPETPLQVLIETVLNEKIAVLPVVNTQEELIGIVTKDSILRYLLENSHFFGEEHSVNEEKSDGNSRNLSKP